MKLNRRDAETQSKLTERRSMSRSTLDCSMLLRPRSDACVDFYALAGFCAPFPLTLTLSLREREQQSTIADNSIGRRAVTAYRLYVGERCGRPKRHNSLHNRRTVLPLPKGEGWGEGKDTVRSLRGHRIRLGPESIITPRLRVSAVK